MNNYKHWQIAIDDKQIAWLGINRQDTALNAINDAVLDELYELLQLISENKALKGAVFYSAKAKGFIAGADVKVFSQFTDAKQAEAFLRKGHTVFARIETLAFPTIALIDGFCMGGGLELALACTYRIASDEEHTRLGLPEILLGIHPGWGGTVRLPQLIGGFDALSKVILPGAALNPYKAKKLGIVDDVVPVRQLKRAAIYFIEKKPPQYRMTFIQSLTNYAPMRALLGPLLRYNIAKRVKKQHYPAPYAVIDLWEKEGAVGERAFLKEIESVEHLISVSDTAKNLIRAFLLRERMKAFAKDNTFKAQKVHVIGAGIMGGDIAAWCALRGLKVTLQDKSYDQIAKAYQRASALFSKKLHQPRLIQAALDRFVPDPEGHGIKHADVIIEAVFENLEIKQSIIKTIEAQASKEALIATNTSSIPLEEINKVMQAPERLVGIHYFNPVAKMELVEIVSSAQTSQEVRDKACVFVNQTGKLPLPVKSSPGFLINRILMPYLMECVQLLEEGYPPEVIDEAAKDFGMFMGPVELADTVGMDVCLAVAENLSQYFQGAIPKKLREMVEQKKLGRKTGEGFYVYKNGKPVKKKITQEYSKQIIANRLILRMVNESAACLREHVVADKDLLDGGMIFATGFAPFRGGPMHYAEDVGKEELKQLFSQFEQEYGARFKMDALLLS